MNQPTLFLMLGFPGAGKTTTAKIIHEQTGAMHVWADHERRRIFSNPSHSPAESRKLYAYLNNVVDGLLAEGKSVIFDTNFNFYKDRQRLRRIASKHGAKTIVVWLATSKLLAKQRAVHDRSLRNGYEFVLSENDFDRMSNHLQLPHEDETVVKLNGTHVTAETVADVLRKI